MEQNPPFAVSLSVSQEEILWQTISPPRDSHNETSKRLILSAANRTAKGRVVVFGAGECREIPLRALADRFESVTLHDLDFSRLQIGMNKPDLTQDHRDRIRLVTYELNGLLDRHVPDIEAELDSLSSVDDAINVVSKRVGSVTISPLDLLDKADLVIASCVLSQLHIPFLERVSDAFKQRFPQGANLLHSSDVWKRAAFALSEKLELGFIKMLRRNVTDSGRVYLSATIHLLKYRITSEGLWATPGMLRACRLPRLEDYVRNEFRIEQQEEWWWHALPTHEPGTAGHALRVEGAILAPSEQQVLN